MEKELKLTVNGEPYDLLIKPRMTLLELLRDYLGLNGAKQACVSNSCGYCTVILGGMSVKACSILALQAKGNEVTTIEGLAKDGELHPLQKAFIDYSAFQCGFCTPGKIMSAKALLDENPKPTEEEIKRDMEGNICRCTGYVNIIKAIKAVSQEL